MIQSLMKLALIATIWRWVKPRWKPLSTLLVVFTMTNIIHAEYIEYVAISKNYDSLTLAYAVKWATLIFSLIVYLLFFERKLNKTADSQETHSKIMDFDTNEDRFEELRNKKVLRRRGKRILGED